MHVQGKEQQKTASPSKQKKEHTYNTQCNKLKMPFKWQRFILLFFKKR